MDNMGQALIVKDVINCLEYANPAVTQLLGYTTQELLGRNYESLIVDEDVQLFKQNLYRRIKGQTTTYEVRLKRSNSETIHTMVTSVPRYKDNV
jgi:PAS domain S-box-containing protein